MYLALSSILQPQPDGSIQKVQEDSKVAIDHTSVDTSSKGWFRKRLLAAAAQLGISDGDVEKLLETSVSASSLSGLLDYLDF